MRVCGFAVALAACGRVGFDPIELDTVVELSVGGKTSCARFESGDVWCWGDNRFLLLGANLVVTQSAIPVRVLAPSPAIAIEVDDHNAFALLAAGGLVGWGTNDRGQLGIGDLTPAPAPIVVPGAADAIDMTSATSVLCMLRADHTVACGGAGTNGALGDGSMTDRATLGSIPGLSNVRSLTGGTSHICALLATGAATCWGNNASGQLGDGTMIESRVPTTGPAGPYTKLSAGDNFTCGLRVDQGIDCWGDNAELQLADPAGGTRPTALPVAGITTATAVTCGAQHACALLADRSVVCWGDDTRAELGDALGDLSATPRRVVLDDVLEISSRTDLATCARTTTGDVYCWGDNTHGNIGNGQLGGLVTAPSRVIGLP